MLHLCLDAAPDLFAGAGPSCAVLGYCPENERQNARCRGYIPTKAQALDLLRAWRRQHGPTAAELTAEQKAELAVRAEELRGMR